MPGVGAEYFDRISRVKELAASPYRAAPLMRSAGRC